MTKWVATLVFFVLALAGNASANSVFIEDRPCRVGLGRVLEQPSRTGSGLLGSVTEFQAGSWFGVGTLLCPPHTPLFEEWQFNAIGDYERQAVACEAASYETLTLREGFFSEPGNSGSGGELDELRVEIQATGGTLTLAGHFFSDPSRRIRVSAPIHLQTPMQSNACGNKLNYTGAGTMHVDPP